MDPTPRVPNVDANYFSGGSHLSTGELEKVLNTAADVDAVRRVHLPVMVATSTKSVAGKEPSLVECGAAAIVAAFTLNTDVAFRQFKVPYAYAGTYAKMHVHWTKTSDANENGKRVRWRLTGTVFESSATVHGDAAATSGVIEVEDIYDDAGTTTRLMHRTAEFDIAPYLAAGRYVSFKIEAITPTGGAAMASEPGLFSVDLIADEYINR